MMTHFAEIAKVRKSGSWILKKANEFISNVWQPYPTASIEFLAASTTHYMNTGFRDAYQDFEGVNPENFPLVECITKKMEASYPVKKRHDLVYAQRTWNVNQDDYIVTRVYFNDGSRETGQGSSQSNGRPEACTFLHPFYSKPLPPGPESTAIGDAFLGLTEMVEEEEKEEGCVPKISMVHASTSTGMPTSNVGTSTGGPTANVGTSNKPTSSVDRNPEENGCSEDDDYLLQDEFNENVDGAVSDIGENQERQGIKRRHATGATEDDVQNENIFESMRKSRRTK